MDCVPASGSCGWFHMRPDISTANDVVRTDVSQLFLSGCQQTLSRSECNLNTKCLTCLNLIYNTRRSYGLAFGNWSFIGNISFLFVQKDISGKQVAVWLATSSGTSTNTLLVEKGLAFVVFSEKIYLVLITFSLIIFYCLPI